MWHCVVWWLRRREKPAPFIIRVHGIISQMTDSNLNGEWTDDMTTVKLWFSTVIFILLLFDCSWGSAFSTFDYAMGWMTLGSNSSRYSLTGGKVTGVWGWPLTTICAMVKNDWSCTSHFPICRHGMYRDTFAVPCSSYVFHSPFFILSFGTRQVCLVLPFPLSQ